MIRRPTSIFFSLVLLAALGGGVFWLLTAPRPLTASALPVHTPDIGNGERIYHAGGCISCHKPATAQPGTAAALPTGGHPLKTPIGTLYPPNLTPDPETGLGLWSELDFANAMLRGVSPDGQHYIPAFPYASYAKMKIEDVLDLRAWLASLPAVRSPGVGQASLVDTVMRRGVGLWKWIGLDETPFAEDASRGESWNRGAYLVTGPGHCGECHTPRNLAMVPDQSRFLGGGPHPDGTMKVPSLRRLAARGRYKSAASLASDFLAYNENMEDGGMGGVQSGLANLPDADRLAIAEYLMSLD